ncbi:MAG TPA: AraC family transcriptional regulator [Burkholderiaceae bacterium]
MSAQVRSASLTYFADIAAERGLDARALLAEVGLPARCLQEPDLKVPVRAVVRLLEMAATRGNEPTFGLRMAASWRLSNLGSLGLLIRDEPTLRQALEAVLSFIHVQNEALVLRVEEVGNLLVIRTELMAEGAGSSHQATEMVVAITLRVLSIFMGASWRPRLVCFTHRAPKDLTAHRRVLGEAVEFGHEFNGIVCNASSLDAPNPGADPVMARYTRRLLEQGARKRAGAIERVRELAVLLLPLGHCRVDAVAQHLGIDRRTVARHLDAEGTTFSEVIDGLRRDLVDRYLKDGERSLGEVSALLGFSAPSAFSRWHRQQFGIAPRSRTTDAPAPRVRGRLRRA